MSRVPKRQQLTPNEYLLAERQATAKSEYCRGELFAMAGATDEHETIAGNCFGHLWQQLQGRDCRVYKADVKVHVVEAGRFAYPDIAVVCGERQFADSRKDVLLNPTVIVEVLSKSTANYDRGEKANDYRRLVSLRALVLVASDEPLVESYVRQLPDQWTLTTLRGLGGLLEIPAIGCRLSVADLYRGVEFPPPPDLRVTPDEEA